MLGEWKAWEEKERKKERQREREREVAIVRLPGKYTHTYYAVLFSTCLQWREENICKIKTNPVGSRGWEESSVALFRSI